MKAPLIISLLFGLGCQVKSAHVTYVRPEATRLEAGSRKYDPIPGDPAALRLEDFAGHATATVDPPVDCGRERMIVVHGRGGRHLARRLPPSCQDREASCPYVTFLQYAKTLRERTGASVVTYECGDHPVLPGVKGLNWQSANRLVGDLIGVLAELSLDEDAAVYLTPD